jgi:hypothetical protein
MYSIIEDLQETICPILNLLDNEWWQTNNL